jgi:hypothetical protein
MKKLILLLFVFQWADFHSQTILEMEQTILKNNFQSHAEIKDFSFYSTDSIEISEDGSHFNISGGLMQFLRGNEIVLLHKQEF